MDNSAKILRWSGVLLAGLGALGTAFAFRFSLNERTGLPIKWPAGTLPIRLLLGTGATTEDTNFNGAAQAAAGIWNAQLGSLQITTTVASGTPSKNNNFNELAFASTVYGEPFDESVLAVTLGSSSSNEAVRSDIIFNSNVTWNSYRGPQQGSTFDLRRVALHELGHMLGLDHPDDNSSAQPRQSVVAVMNSRISGLDNLAGDDIDGARAMYGPPNNPPNDNFANAATLSFDAGTFAVSGYNTRATKETGEPNHAGNAGGRSVWYRWTPTGSGTATLDTRGSYYDTTLAVYTGNAPSSLTSVASNDDITDGIVQASTVTFNTTAGVTYRIAVDGFNGDASGADNGTFKLNLSLAGVAPTAPTIATQPLSTTVTAGQSAGFSVTVNGSGPISYQWLFNGTAISGATLSSYSITSAQAADAGKYSVKATNAVGSVTSNEATLTVQAVVTPPPPVTPTPPSGGGGGGGGAPSVWFVALLAALGLGRFASRRDC